MKRCARCPASGQCDLCTIEDGPTLLARAAKAEAAHLEQVALTIKLANEVERLLAALRAIVDEITDDSHEDSEDLDEMLDSLMKIQGLAAEALRPTAAKPTEGT